MTSGDVTARRRIGGRLFLAIMIAATATVEPRAQPEAPAPPAAPVTDGGVPVDDIAMSPDDTGEEPGGIDAGAPAVDAPAVPKDPAARDKWLATRLTQITAPSPALLTSRIGVAIVDLETGKTLWTKDGDGRYNLASNAKLFTTATALARLGTGFRWRTVALVDKDGFDPASGEIAGDLWLRGRGDPTLSLADFDQIADDLRAIGVRTVHGGLVLDRGYFDGVDEPPHYDEQKKERAGFRAPISSLAVNGNSITIALEPDPAGFLPTSVRLVPDVPDYIKLVQAEVMTITTGRSRLRIDTVAKKDHVEMKILGQLRLDEGPDWIRRRIDDPARFAGELFKRSLARKGITLGKKKVASGAAPRMARVLAWHDSEPLGDILRAMSKTSNNFIAEAILKTIGAETRATPGPATWQDGLTAVRSYAADTCQIGGAFRIDNGSGLYNASDVTPQQVVQLLACAHRDYRVGPDLVAALPTAGVDGTLGRRVRLSPARGRIRAKTGTLASVSTVAGYAGVDGGHVLAFAILVNDIPPGARPFARVVQDQIFDAMVAYLDGR